MQPDPILQENFRKSLDTQGLIVPSSEIKQFLSTHKSLLLNIKHTKIVYPHEDPDKKIVLIQPEVELPESLASYEKVKKTVELDYSNFSYSQVLKQVLPENLTIPTGFETVGHIAHFNLSAELYPYRHTIGRVLIDVITKQKTPNIKTVVTKLEKINNVYRTFQMEIIAGEDNYITTVKEGCCKFTFDFSSVYWNSKLSAERDRVLGQLKKTDIVCDVFAGVGPFSIRAAKIGCKVLANDLNPASYEYLSKNIEKNKVGGKVKAFNQDARVFLTELLGNGMPELQEFLPFTDIYMNLPMDAIEFLDVLKGRFDREVWKSLPTVHVYGFANEVSELINRIQGVWGDFDMTCLKFHQIRDISPKKYMFCVEFVIPENIAYGSDAEKLRKIRKVEE